MYGLSSALVQLRQFSLLECIDAVLPNQRPFGFSESTPSVYHRVAGFECTYRIFGFIGYRLLGLLHISQAGLRVGDIVTTMGHGREYPASKYELEAWIRGVSCG